MTHIIDQIRRCASLLASVRESHWSEELRPFADDSSDAELDIHKIKKIVSWFGGMGSLSDVYICRLNHHHVPEGQEDELNAALSEITDSIYDSAMEAEREMR